MHAPADRTLAALASALLLASTLRAQAIRYELVPAQSRVWFDAEATMGRFQGTAQQVSGWADVSDTTSFAHTRGEVVVAAASFHTGVALRNQHLRNEMEVQRYPFVRFVLEGSDAAQPGAIVLHGRLMVKDHAAPVSIHATVSRANGELTLDGDLPTKFTGLGMKPPTRMAGMTRVRDDFVIHFHVVFRRG